MAAGQNSSCGPAGRRHYHEDRERLEEAQHTPALPGAVRGLFVNVSFAERIVFN